MRRTFTRAGRVLLAVLLVVAGAGFAQQAVVQLRDRGRTGALLAFLQCLLAVAIWTLAGAWWSHTRRPRTAGGAANDESSR